MNNSIKNNLFLTVLLLVTMLFLMYDVAAKEFTLKAAIPAIIFFVGMWYEYVRGYNAGKAFYTDQNPVPAAKASKDWDHRKSLREVLEQHPFCLLELDHAPCQEHDYPMPSGRIHLVQNDKHFTTIELADDGWIYSADTSIGRDLIQTGKYQPMLTKHAVNIVHDKIWDIHF